MCLAFRARCLPSQGLKGTPGICEGVPTPKGGRRNVYSRVHCSMLPQDFSAVPGEGRTLLASSLKVCVQRWQPLPCLRSWPQKRRHSKCLSGVLPSPNPSEGFTPPLPACFSPPLPALSFDPLAHLFVLKWIKMMSKFANMVCILSHVWLIVTPWTVVLQAPLSMGFSRQEY